MICSNHRQEQDQAGTQQSRFYMFDGLLNKFVFIQSNEDKSDSCYYCNDAVKPGDGFILFCNISGAGGHLRAVLFGRGQDELGADPVECKIGGFCFSWN